MLQTSRKGKDLGEVIEERSSGLLKNTGMVLVQQKKNLIIICRGWQCGIWLVEIVSAMLNYVVNFWASLFRLCCDGEGRIQGRIARSVSVYICWWPELRHTATVTHTRRFPRFGQDEKSYPQADAADSVAVYLPSSHHPEESLGLTRQG